MFGKVVALHFYDRTCVEYHNHIKQAKSQYICKLTIDVALVQLLYVAPEIWQYLAKHSNSSCFWAM